MHNKLAYSDPLGSSGKSGPSLIMHDTEWAWYIQLTSALLAVNLKHERAFGGKLESEVLTACLTMSLLELGPTIFGGNDKIFAYFRAKGLLARSKLCARYYSYKGNQ